MRGLIAAVVAVAVAMLPGCGVSADPDGPPSSLFDQSGYHVRGDKVYYLDAFPGKAFEIDGADPASFESFDTTYAHDESTVYYNGRPLADADARSFAVLDRPGFAKDRDHVYLNDRAFSDDPARFELLDGGLSRDSTRVYWSDGSVLSSDPTHFVIISNNDHYLYASDRQDVYVNGSPVAGADPWTFRVLAGAYARDDAGVFYFTDAIPQADGASFRTLEGPYAADRVRVYWMGKPIDGADPNSFRVLNADFECAADDARAYYRQSVVVGADPQTFPPDREVTNCDESSISFAG